MYVYVSVKYFQYVCFCTAVPADLHLHIHFTLLRDADYIYIMHCCLAMLGSWVHIPPRKTSAWSLYVFHIFAWVSSRYSGFPNTPKNILIG